MANLSLSMRQRTAAADTPLRRSRANISSRGAPSPVINDDEAERRASRMVSESTADTSVQPALDREGLLGCLKIYTENKINKNNAWNMSLIDNFASLVHRHHKSMQDFQFIGTTLDASCKIYGLRVDSVHADVMNMANGLGKFSLANRQQGDDGEGDGDDGAAAMDTSQTGGGADGDQPTAPKTKKAKRKNVARCTLVRNMGTINAKLDTYPLCEPTFAKLNSTIGDINSSKRLLNYVLSSVHSELKHRSDLPFWDAVEHPVCTADAAAVASATGAAPAAAEPMVRLTGLGALLNPDLCMRQELKGYKICSTPIADHDEDFNNSDFNMLNDSSNEAAAAASSDSPPAVALNQSHFDLAFDVNAEIEPCDEPQQEYMETGFDADDLNEMDAEDVQAICAVRSLRRNATQLDDMRPVDSQSTLLEYSYRPLEKISRFWAGPSYWKIHKPRRTTANGADQPSTAVINRQAVQRVRQAADQRKRIEPVEFVPDAEFDDSMFISVQSAEAQKLRKINIYKRWDAKKLRLPTDLHLDRQRFDKYYFAPGLQVEWSKEPVHSVVSQTSAYNYDNAEDREYCSNLQLDDDREADGGSAAEADRTGSSDGGGNLLGGDGTQANLNQSDGGAGGQHNQSAVGFIGSQFMGAGGAPKIVEKIDIPFARRAKVVDMKQLKRCCLQLIGKQQRKQQPDLPKSQMLNPKTNKLEDLRYVEGAATFRDTFGHLPAVLSQDQRVALSTATAFYSILHLANDHQLDLINIDEDNFYIRQIQQAEATTAATVVE